MIFENICDHISIIKEAVGEQTITSLKKKGNASNQLTSQDVVSHPSSQFLNFVLVKHPAADAGNGDRWYKL